MSINLNRILKDAALRRLNAESQALPTPRTIREPSPTKRNASYLPVNYGLLFCCHAKSYFDTCPSCKRTRRDARRQYEYFCLKNGVACQ